MRQLVWHLPIVRRHRCRTPSAVSTSRADSSCSTRPRRSCSPIMAIADANDGSDVRGDPKEFAIVIPVPTVFQREQITSSTRRTTSTRTPRLHLSNISTTIVKPLPVQTPAMSGWRATQRRWRGKMTRSGSD